MAVTVAATLITVTSGTETIDSIYVAVAASAFPAIMTKTGTDPYVYTLVGNIKLLINGGTTLNMSNVGDTLQWGSRTANMAPAFQVQANSTFTMAAGTTLDFDSSTSNKYSYWYIYGNTTLTGTSGNGITIKNHYANRFFLTTDSISAHTWIYVTCELNSGYTTSLPGFYFDSAADVKPAWSFTFITINSTTTRGYAMTAYPGTDLTGCTFDNWTISQVRYGISSFGSTFKFTNSTFKNINNAWFIRGTGANPHYTSAGESSNMNTTSMYQPKITFDTCTFTDNYDVSTTERGFYLSYGAVIKFKDCTFSGVDDQLATGANAYYNSRLLYEGTTTFTNVGVGANRIWSTNGSHYHVWPLTLTVQDQNGTAIQNAEVMVVQNSANEYWYFRTDASGNINDCFGDDPVFVEKEETSNGVYTQWSDSIASSRYHTIRIFKDGYAPWSRQVTFTAAQTITATLVSQTSAGSKTLPVSF